MTNEWLTQLEVHFWPDGFRRNVWMIADAARDPRIFPMLRQYHMEHYCLYSGPLPPALEAAAPYLVQLDYGDPQTRRFLAQAWGNSWGVFLKCGIHQKTLRRHLCEFLIVSDSEGRPLLFRYYDPRVLREYLPTCTGDELRIIFGPIQRLWMEDQEPSLLLDFGLDQSGLSQNKRSLASV